MQFYKLIIKSIPNFRFAHSYETKSYKVQFRKIPNKMEFTYVETGDVYIKNENSDLRFYKSPYFTQICFNQNETIYSNSDFHKHYTFSVSYDYEIIPLVEEDIVHLWKSGILNNTENNITAKLPEFVDDIDVLKKLKEHVKNIIYKYNSDKITQQPSCMVDFFDILTILTDWSTKKVLSSDSLSISPIEILYCNKTIKYISEHLNKKIRIKDIADFLGISSGHLSRIFKSIYNCSIIEYINIQKIELSKELLLKNIPIHKLIESIGITDEKYFYRLFRQITGITTSEYKNSFKALND